MVAFRAADLQDRGKGLPGRPGAVVAAPAGAGVAAGTLVTFCHPVVSVPAVVCRGGTVRAGGWLPDFVRLGELERHIGDEVIEAIAARAVASGRVPAPQRRRLMSLPLVMRLTVAMTLMPGSGYAQVARQLAGHLADVPSARDWHVPTSKVFTGWRDMACPSPMEDLFWQVAGPLVADDAPSAALLAGMPVCGIDGMVVNVADTPHNRAAFGCAGTKTKKGYGEAPFPQVQAVVVTARAARATLGAIMGAARAGEQALLARLIRRRRSCSPGGCSASIATSPAIRSSPRSWTPAGTWSPGSRPGSRCRPPPAGG